jgi:hypothetical protein
VDLHAVKISLDHDEAFLLRGNRPVQVVQLLPFSESCRQFVPRLALVDAPASVTSAVAVTSTLSLVAAEEFGAFLL